MQLYSQHFYCAPSQCWFGHVTMISTFLSGVRNLGLHLERVHGQKQLVSAAGVCSDGGTPNAPNGAPAKLLVEPVSNALTARGIMMHLGYPLFCECVMYSLP